MNEEIKALQGIPPWAETVSVSTVRDLIKEAYYEGFDTCREELDDAEDAEAEEVETLTITRGPNSPPRIFNPAEVTLFFAGIPLECSDSDFLFVSIEKDRDWANDLAAQTVEDSGISGNVSQLNSLEEQIAADLRTAHQKGRDEYKAEHFRPISVGYALPVRSISYTEIQRGDN